MFHPPVDQLIHTAELEATPNTLQPPDGEHHAGAYEGFLLKVSDSSFCHEPEIMFNSFFDQ